MCVIFVLKLGKGVFTFTLDPMYSKYVITQENIEIPKAGKYTLSRKGTTSCGTRIWSSTLVISRTQVQVGNLTRQGTLELWSETFHRTLLYGVIYVYPRDTKSKNRKVRLMYEYALMSFIDEQAGGKWSCGHKRVQISN